MSSVTARSKQIHVAFPHAAWSEALSAIRTVSLHDLYLLPSPARFDSSDAYTPFVEIQERADERATARTLADAIHYLKLAFAKRLGRGVFWQKRYYDRNVRDEPEFLEKLRYIHRNPVKRGLCESAGDWKWSSFRHYALRKKGVVEIESERTARDRERQALGGPEGILLIPG